MIFLYLLVTLLGALLTARLATWRSPHVFTAATGTLLGGLAILSGFSIGVYIAPAAVALIAAAAAPHLQPRGRSDLQP